jgi:hypothetical protein
LADWYFAAEGAPDGPHNEEDIRGLFQSGRLNGDTLVWSEGMQQWAPLRLQEPFKKLGVSPPPLPPQELIVEHITEPVASAPVVEKVKPEPALMSRSSWAPVMDEPVASEDKKPDGWGEPIFVPPAERRDLNRNSPWSRYFARALDLTITSYLAGLGVGYALAYWAPSLYLQLVSQQAQVQNLILLPVALILNGIVTGIFGTTIGKSVMALRFTYLNGHLGLIGQIVRELKVWIQGLAFGIPLVSIFSGVFQYRRVTKGLPASYDEGIVLVKQDDIPIWRRAVGMLFCALVFVGGIAYSVWPEPIARQVRHRSSRWNGPIQTPANASCCQRVGLRRLRTMAKERWSMSSTMRMAPSRRSLAQRAKSPGSPTLRPMARPSRLGSPTR